MGKSVKEGIMPRETVRSADYQFVPIKDGDDGAARWDESCRLGVLEIGWSKHPTGHVEIATADDSLLFNLYKQVGEAVTNGGDPEVVVRDFFHGGGLWISLNYDGCNEAIRRIRKARDDAFGRPE